MVTTKQKPMVNTQRMKRKNYNQTTKESHQTTREERARKEKEETE